MTVNSLNNLWLPEDILWSYFMYTPFIVPVITAAGYGYESRTLLYSLSFISHRMW